MAKCYKILQKKLILIETKLMLTYNVLRQIMKNLIKSIILIAIFAFSFNSCFSVQTFDDKKKEIIALYNSNSLDEAYQMISAVPEDERDAELWFLLGNLTQDFNNDVNAAFFLQKATILDPKFDKAHYNLANIYLKEKKYNSAINEYKLAIKYKKDFPYYYYNLGCAYLGQKDYKSARAEFQKAIKLKSDDASFYYNLAFSENKLNKKIEAQKSLDMYNKLKDK